MTTKTPDNRPLDEVQFESDLRIAEQAKPTVTEDGISISEDLKTIEHDVERFIEGVFSRVSEDQLPVAYHTKVTKGVFGCDDYGLLFKTVYGYRPDLAELMEKANTLAVMKGKTALSNQKVATILESVAIHFEEDKELHKVVLTGFWRAKPPM